MNISPNDNKNVIIKAPPAIFHVQDIKNENPITPLDMIELLKSRILLLEGEIVAAKTAASTICNAAICLARMLIDNNYGKDNNTIVIPLELWNRIIGSQITLNETGLGTVEVKIRERSPNFID